MWTVSLFFLKKVYIYIYLGERESVREREGEREREKERGGVLLKDNALENRLGSWWLNSGW